VLARQLIGRYSTHLHLFGLVAAVVVPLIAFAALVLVRYADAEQARIEQEAIRIASQTGLLVEAELKRQIAKLEALTSSSALANNDFARFHAEAKLLVEGREDILVLRDLGARQLFNTQRPYGAELPPAVPISAEDKANLNRGQPVVSDVYKSPLSGEPRIAVALPIIRNGAAAYVLAITVPTTHVRDALLPATPAGWVVAVGDRQGAYVARSMRHEDVSGNPGLPEYIQQVVGRSGKFTSANFEGLLLLAGYSRSDVSGWFFTANIPLNTVHQPLRDSLTNLAAIGVAALVLSGLLAITFSQGITSATAGLAERARRLGEGQSITPLTTQLSEFATVGDALVTASLAIAERVRERERALEREALLASIFDATGIYVGVVEARGDDQYFVVANRAAAAIFGRTEQTLIGAAAGALALDQADLAQWLSLCRRAGAEAAPITAEFSLRPADGDRRLYLGTFTAIPSGPEGRRRVAFTAMDITERKRSEEQRQLLVNELNHRVKNSLTIVQSIASQTLRSANSVADARAALTGRLISLARTHDVLTKENWEGAYLDDIIAHITEAYGGSERISAQGPSVRLPPPLALTLSLVLHELMTNSAKYGAMAVEGGRVNIRWRTEESPTGKRLAMRFEETSGPAVAPPAHKGFGSRLFEASFSSAQEGNIRLDYRPGGLVCEIETALAA
jgi:PAS domain S-box-containing protein